MYDHNNPHNPGSNRNGTQTLAMLVNTAQQTSQGATVNKNIRTKTLYK